MSRAFSNKKATVLALPFVLLVRSGVSVAAQQAETEERSLKELSVMLENDSENVPLADVRVALRHAGDSGNVDLLPQLETIAENGHLDHLIVHGAMDALWRLGVGEEYFLQFLQSPEISSNQQTSALYVLARNSSDKAAQAVRLITWQAADNRLSGAIQVYRFSRRQQMKYTELSDIGDRVRFLSPLASRGYNTLRIDENDPETSLFPLTIWARSELRSLCGDNPSVTAAAAANYVKELKHSTGAPWERSFERYFQDLLLPGECRELFQKRYVSDP